MATEYLEFVVSEDPATARSTAERVLVDRKFRVTWQEERTGTAERGSKVATATVSLGGSLQYIKVGIALNSAQPGETAVRVQRSSSGWLGGWTGAAKTRKSWASLHEELSAAFTAAGVLQGVREGSA